MKGELTKEDEAPPDGKKAPAPKKAEVCRLFALRNVSLCVSCADSSLWQRVPRHSLVCNGSVSQKGGRGTCALELQRALGDDMIDLGLGWAVWQLCLLERQDRGYRCIARHAF